MIEGLNGRYNFNGSLIVKNMQDNYSFVITDQSDKIYLLYRSNYHKFDITSDLIFTQIINKGDGYIVNDQSQYSIVSLNLKREDPRFFIYNGTPWYSYTYVDKNIKVCYSQLNRNDNNYLSICENSINEKNWVFFSHLNALYVIRYFNPMVIYKIDNLFFRTPLLITRQIDYIDRYQNDIRGGTQPVFINGYYYHIVHTKDYHMVLGRFQFTDTDTVSVNPYVYEYSDSYLLEKKGNEKIHYPCGLLYDEMNDQLICSYGINDESIDILYISMSTMAQVKWAKSTIKYQHQLGMCGHLYTYYNPFSLRLRLILKPVVKFNSCVIIGSNNEFALNLSYLFSHYKNKSNVYVFDETTEFDLLKYCIKINNISNIRPYNCTITKAIVSQLPVHNYDNNQYNLFIINDPLHIKTIKSFMTRINTCICIPSQYKYRHVSYRVKTCDNYDILFRINNK